MCRHNSRIDSYVRGMRDAESKGFAAGQDPGFAEEDNPYRRIEHRCCWMDGFRRARTEASMTEDQKGFLRLIERSPDRGDGWRSISEVLLPVCEKVAGQLPELLEFERENSRIRFTEKGEGALFAL